MGILIDIALNILIALGSMAILTDLIFVVQEHGISISLSYLQFPLLMFYSFQHINLSPPW